MAKVKFYSKQEIKALTKVINSGEKLTVASKRLSEQFGRTEGSVYVKLLDLSGRVGKRKSQQKTAKIVTQNSDKGGVTLRNGFVFDFKPQRAEMFQDHVRIYF